MCHLKGRFLRYGGLLFKYKVPHEGLDFNTSSQSSSFSHLQE